jgi:hypothetical protein
MLRGRPTPFGGALVEPKQRRFFFILKIARGLQPATSAISLALNSLLWLISLITACCDSARFGAILGSE